jgi:hypothetical protein
MKERTPQWRRCAPEPAAAREAAEADSEAAGEARRKPDVVAAVAADSRFPTRSLTWSRPGWRQGCALATTSMGPRLGRAMPLHLVGKLVGPGRLNAVAAGQLIHMQDQITNRCLLVNTGASYSIIPHHSSLPATGPKLFGMAGQLIPCWGDRLMKLRFQDQDFSWKIFISRCSFPHLGRGFFEILQTAN